MNARDAKAPTVSFREAVGVWSRIGWLSFGGPAGQIALMHRELVERRRWISETRFLHALNYCMLLPGPEAQQLATYIGWLLHRLPGGVVAGALFVLPGFIAILLLSILYALFGQVPAIAAVFFGLKAAVLAIVVEAVVRIGRRALKNRYPIAIAAAAFIAIYFFGVGFPWIVGVAALIGFLASKTLAPAKRTENERQSDEAGYLIDALHARGALSHAIPSAGRATRTALVCVLLWLSPVAIAALLLGTQHVLTREGLFFSQTAVVTFGGAYAVLAYVGQRAVQDLQWLAPGEMLDGLALAETTPGPLIMVLQFVGFLAAFRYPGTLDPWVAAVLGAILTTWVTFLPSFMFIFVGAPYVESLRHLQRLNGALAALTAAVVGVILNLSVWFAVHTLFGEVRGERIGLFQFERPVWHTVEPGALVLTVAALVATLRYKLGMAWTLIGCAILGAAYVHVLRS
ncbi:MAG: chromate efflux transporter [Steroidobacteraceae bacterium]|nr:chromate efflux transporter [Steroidobacteraceae bacterium]